MENTPTTIKHIVLSGGGAQGFTFYGILREANKAGLWDFKNIQTIYGTSIGAFFAVILCLNFEWDILDDFLIKRPWHTVLKLDLPAYLRVFEKKGMVNKKIYENAVKPLFDAKDIPIDITMKDFYEITGIDLHIFTVEVNQLKVVDVSYKTHPEWTVVKALHCSSTLPIIFEPYMEENNIYIDGGILVNYPVNRCILNGAKPDEIIGVYKINNIYNKNMDENTTFIDYILGILNRIFDKIMTISEGSIHTIKYEYNIKESSVNIGNLSLTATSMEERTRLIQTGVDIFHNSE